MNLYEFEDYKRENGTGSEQRYYNKIDYVFVYLRDGWIAIFERTQSGHYIPLIQARDLIHAEMFCDRREPITVPLQQLC